MIRYDSLPKAIGEYNLPISSRSGYASRSYSRVSPGEFPVMAGKLPDLFPRLASRNVYDSSMMFRGDSELRGYTLPKPISLPYFSAESVSGKTDLGVIPTLNRL